MTQIERKRDIVMNSKNVPSVKYMEAITPEIKPFGVQYYTRKVTSDKITCYPLYRETFEKYPRQKDELTVQSIEDYLKHYRGINNRIK
jgi:hypothetical protein